MDYISLLSSNQHYLLYLAGVMIASGYVRDLNVLVPVYNWILRKVKSKRAIVAIISSITGVLPIPGRVIVSAGFLDTIACEDKKKREMFGIIDYLTTHHYYLWSPLEKSVIMPMAALGLSYGSFLYIMGPLLLTTFAVILFYIFYVLKEEHIEFRSNTIAAADTNTQSNPLNYVNWNALLILAAVIIAGNFAREYTDVLIEVIRGNTTSFWLVSGLSFFASFVLGSSSRFAAIATVCILVFGVEYLPWFFAIDYAGYMMSPTHKCLAIGKSYFNTPITEYYKAISVLVASILTVAFILL